MSQAASRVVHVGGQHPYHITIGDGLLDDVFPYPDSLRFKHRLARAGRQAPADGAFFNALVQRSDGQSAGASNPPFPAQGATHE